MLTADDLLTHPAARRLALARDAAAALTANGWRVKQAARHAAGTADIAAERSWSRGRLTARVRLVIRCDSREERLVFSALDDAADRIPFYSLGDDDPQQRRMLAKLFDDAQPHEAVYPREKALIAPAQLNAPRAR